MAPAPGGDLVVQAALAVSLIAGVLVAGLALQILQMRLVQGQRERRAARFVAAWRPLLFQATLGEQAALPRLERRDEESFLLLWNELQDGLRGMPRAGLNRLAEAVRAHDVAVRRLRSGVMLQRLLALRTLGYLGRAADYGAVRAFLDDRRPYVSAAAARALVHIDPQRAPEELWPRLLSRPDWPVAQFAAVLREADLERLAGLLRSTLPGLAPSQLVRVLPLLSILGPETADALAGGLLEGADDPDVLAQALKQARGGSLLPAAERLSRHPAWPVRTQAAAALGRFGGAAQRDLLLRMIRDPQWWVRYRAAQALLSGPFGSADEVKAAAAASGDRFAVDMLAHVQAEGRA